MLSEGPSILNSRSRLASFLHKMRTASLFTSILSLATFAATKPVLETRQPAACPYDCFASVSTQQLGDPSSLKVLWSESPGCDTCPGHNCTGRASAIETWLDGETQFIEEYWYCEPLI